MKHKPHALLIAGSEDRHKTHIHDLSASISSVCKKLEVRNLQSVMNTITTIREFCAEAPKTAPLLVAFNGHGSPDGWESSSTKHHVSYAHIVDVVAAFPHRILFLNDTSYGQFLIKELIGNRSSRITSCITSWEGDQTSHSEVIVGAAKNWPKGQRFENEVSVQQYSDATGDYDFPAQQRWGSIMDPFFYSKP